MALYKQAAAFLRGYANLANEMREAGYSDAETQEIKAEVAHFESVRREVKLSSGDYIDLKVYEPAMRHLLDMYVQAEDSKVLSTFDDLTLIQLIVERGEAGLDELPHRLRQNQVSLAETIENNVRRLIVDEMAVNPKYYEQMSRLLEALILQRKQAAFDYRQYVEKIIALTRMVNQPETHAAYPARIHSRALRALYDNLDGAGDAREEKALALDRAIRNQKKDDWRGHTMKEREVLHAIRSALGDDMHLAPTLFEIVKAQRDY